MRSILKVGGIVLATILFLSIQIKSRTIYSYVYKVISPLTIAAQDVTEGFFKSSVKNTEEYSRKIFDNTVPKMRDTVKSKMSSHSSKAAEPLEDISVDEKEQLDELIKSHR